MILYIVTLIEYLPIEWLLPTVPTKYEVRLGQWDDILMNTTALAEKIKTYGCWNWRKLSTPQFCHSSVCDPSRRPFDIQQNNIWQSYIESKKTSCCALLFYRDDYSLGWNKFPSSWWSWPPCISRPSMSKKYASCRTRQEYGHQRCPIQVPLLYWG